MKSVWNIGCFVVAAVAATSAFAQQSVQWDSTKSILAGQGCTRDVDSFVTQNGNDLSMVFTRLGVDLPGGVSKVLAARSSCTARVPATVAPGYYIAELSQQVTFGVTKTSRTIGSVATTSTFFGFNMSPYTIMLPRGQALNEPLMVQRRQDRFSVQTSPSWYNGWCSRSRALKGVYQANISVAGQKDRPEDDLIMFVDGLDLKYEIVAGLVRCQL